MKRALLGATAIVSASFSPLMTTPAFADATQTPSALGLTDTAGEQTQCNALAAAHDTQNGDIWTAVVVPGTATLVAGPTEVSGSRTIDQNSITPTGTYVPGHLYINGEPFRTGGSVNLFGDQRSSAGYYPDSTYNYTASFTSTFSYGFSCDVKDAVYHAAYTDPAVPMQGYYTVDPQAPGNSEANRQNCDAFTALGSQDPRPTWWGQYHAWCDFVKTADAIPAVYHPAYNSPAVLVDNEAGTAITQDQTDTLNGFEQHGGIVYVTAEYDVGQVVVCISPGKKGGTWTKQNGYTGSNCTTPYFQSAPWGNGSQTSQGTFISVPNYSY